MQRLQVIFYKVNIILVFTCKYRLIYLKYLIIVTLFIYISAKCPFTFDIYLGLKLFVLHFLSILFIFYFIFWVEILIDLNILSNHFKRSSGYAFDIFFIQALFY